MTTTSSESTTIGLLHPGEMGAAVGACLRGAGHRVVWASQGRGPETAERADRAGLEDVGTVDEVIAVSDIVLSIVPPHAARDIVDLVGGRARVFIDANATSPADSAQLRAVVEGAGGVYVDGSIIGLPPSLERPVRLFVSGAGATALISALTCPGLEIVEAPGDSGASAVKMTYAAWTKGTQALLLASLATARALGVEDELRAEWDRSQPHLPALAEAAGSAAATKGWRWVYEMRQISETFESAGQPGGFHEAAAQVFDS